MKALCVYCGSNPGADPEYAAIATGFGALLASKGITLVYGGGNLGLMGAVADGALGAGGRVIGVMPRSLIEKEVAHQKLTELHAVSSMHERKMKMAELSDAFVALPGGMGTLEEIFEVCTWSQLGFHQKPCAFLNVAGFYSSLLGFLKHMVQERFMKEENYLSIIVESDPEQLLDRLASYRYVAVDKWLDRTVGA
jgi:uncharacterized protein (TIGR00730 family)